MKADHVLPSGGQWNQRAAHMRAVSRSLTAATWKREAVGPASTDQVDISESGQAMSEMERTIKSLQEYAGWGNFNIDFSQDDQSGSLVIRIIDRDSGEVIRQIPPDEILSLRSHLKELLSEGFDETI